MCNPVQWVSDKISQAGTDIAEKKPSEVFEGAGQSMGSYDPLLQHMGHESAVLTQEIAKSPILSAIDAGVAGFFGGKWGAMAANAKNTKERGGTLGDSARSAALTYVAGKVGGTVGGSVGESTGSPLSGQIAGGSAGGATTAALQGKSIGEGAKAGAISAGTTGALEAGLGSINPPSVSGTGLDPSKTGGEGFKYTPTAPAPSETGATDYSLGAGVTDIGGLGLKPQDPSATGAISGDTTDTTNKELASLISQGLRMQGGQKSTTIGGTPATTAAPAAYGATDVIGTQGTPGEIESKGTKKTEEYPWGEPEGTSALKEGLGI